jgi:hypothetical protein
LTSALIQISAPVVWVACETFLTLTGVVAHGVDAKGIGATCSWFQTFIDVSAFDFAVTFEAGLTFAHKMGR